MEEDATGSGPADASERDILRTIQQSIRNEIRTYSSRPSDTEDTISLAEFLARYLVHRRDIGPVFSPSSWSSWLLGGERAPISANPDGIAYCAYSWREYLRRYQGVPAHLFVFHSLSDADVRKLSPQERKNIPYFDHAGRSSLTAEYDDDTLVPYECEGTAILLPNPRDADRPVAILHNTEDIDTWLQVFDMDELRQKTENGEVAAILFPLCTPDIRLPKRA